MHSLLRLAACLTLLLSAVATAQATPTPRPAGSPRPRAREAGVVIGQMPTGRWNAITDVPGVRVGHTTLVEGQDIRTGVTAILPHPGNLFREKVPAAIFVGNGFGKLAGSTQVAELGEIETPILLTNTLNVPRVADALIDWMLALPGNDTVRSINPIVAETNDGFLNDIRRRPIDRTHVFAALDSAASGPVPEGSLGAGTGTICFGYKGGIGTASRLVSGHTLGVLVQTNFGGQLTIAGVPIPDRLHTTDAPNSGDGSIIIVIATDAPLDARLLRRLALRALLALPRTGSIMTNSSGDYVIAFCTAPENRIHTGRDTHSLRLLDNAAMTPLFKAAVEATEEAILNSLFRAESMSGFRGSHVPALPVDEILPLLRHSGATPPPAQR